MITIRSWWKNGVIYQIYPRSFLDTNQDGIGDLAGVTQKLDYLVDLGIDAIWLSPIYPSPDIDFGYDVANYVDVDPKYGTLADFDHLVENAHQRNIKIILDLVLNHTSDQHPWFIESRKSKTNPYHDWYIWRDPLIEGQTPNNWLSIFGGGAWEYVESLGQYYYHMFYKQQPDLNWRHPPVRQAMLDVYRFWLERGVDGFRMDVFNMFFKDELFRSNPKGGKGLRSFDRQNHLFDMSQPEMHPLLNEIRQLLNSYGVTYMIGETFNADAKKAASYISIEELHAGFQFDLLNARFSAIAYRKAIVDWLAALGDKWPNFVLNNHDTPRSATRYHAPEDDAILKVSATALLTIRGTPFLYYGEEIGMRNIFLWRHQILDPVSKRYWPFIKTRDGCRSPMQWDDSYNAGFSEQKPWLPVHPNSIQRNVQSQANQPDSLINFYKRLLKLRRDHPALNDGTLQMIDPKNQRVLAYMRKSDNEKILVCLNMSRNSGSLSLPKELSDSNWSILLSQFIAEEQFTFQSKIIIQPYETLILCQK